MVEGGATSLWGDTVKVLETSSVRFKERRRMRREERKEERKVSTILMFM